MKRRILIALTLLALAGAAARAEGRFGAPGDLYYHALPDCAGGEYAEAADLEGLYPCPVCVPDGTDYPGLELFDLGGLTVIRMSDAFMASREDISGVFGFTAPEDYEGRDAEVELARDLHGEAYAAFRRDMAAGRAEATLYAASSILGGRDSFLRVSICAPRHIGGAWLEVLPPLDAVEEPELNPRFFAGPLTWAEGRLSVDTPWEWNAYMKAPDLRVLDIAPDLTAEGGAWSLALYRAEGMNIAAVRLAGEDALLEPDVRLDCPGWPGAIVMSEPWREGETALYGCALTDAEAARLLAGEAPRIEYAGFADAPVDYQGTPYGIGVTDQSDRYLVDRDGRVLLPPEFFSMERTGNVFVAGAWRADNLGSTDYIVYDADAGQTLFRGEDMTLLLETFPGGFYMPEYNRTTLTRAGEDAPAVTLAARNGYGDETRITLWGDPDIYFCTYTRAVENWFSYDGGQPPVPEGCLLGCVEVDERNCAFIVWRPDGGEKPSAEALGLTNRFGAPLRRLESGAVTVDRARCVAEMNRVERVVKRVLARLSGR